MPSQQSLDVAAGCRTCGLELGHDSAATNDRVGLSAVLDTIKQVSEAA